MVALFPTQERELYVVEETVPGTIPASIGVPVPFTSFKLSNKPLWLDDDSFQGSMGDTYGVYQGPLIAGYDIGGHVFGDTLPYFLLDITGDYTATGTAGSGSTTLTAPLVAGATTATVGSITGFSSGQAVQLGVTGDGNPEIVILSTAPSGSTLTFTNTPARFAHASGKAVAGMVAPYLHVFSILNGLVGAPYAGQAAQPKTLCITDVTGIPATGLADQYAYCCLSELTLTGNAEQLFDWSAKAICYTRQVPGSPVATTNVSGVQPSPSWRSVVGIGGVASGGTQVKNVAEWAVTLTRAVKAFNTNQGAQTPYAIGRGKVGVTGTNKFSPSIDDTALTNLLGNVQPQLQYVAGNGLAGASLVQTQIDIGLGAYLTADIDDSAELFGYGTTFKAPHTAATFTGPQNGVLYGASGGKSAIKIAITNAVPTY